MNWSKLKTEVELLVSTFPQRAAQARHGIQLVEQGLAELAKVGYSYQPVLKDTLAAIEEGSKTTTLTVEEAVGHVTGKNAPGFLHNPSTVEHESSAVYPQEASHAQ